MPETAGMITMLSSISTANKTNNTAMTLKNDRVLLFITKDYFNVNKDKESGKL